jgi:hypothetical protein
MSTHDQKVYIAGIVDGEGCIHIVEYKPSKTNHRKNSAFSLWIVITNTNKKLIDWLFSTIGKGSIQYQDQGKKRKPVYRLKLCDSDAYELLFYVYGYLIVKEKQARLAIEYYENRQNKKKREFYRNKIKELNKRGL